MIKAFQQGIRIGRVLNYSAGWSAGTGQLGPAGQCALALRFS